MEGVLQNKKDEKIGGRYKKMDMKWKGRRWKEKEHKGGWGIDWKGIGRDFFKKKENKYLATMMGTSFS